MLFIVEYLHNRGYTNDPPTGKLEMSSEGEDN
jgi:hypothetical protein